MTKGLRAAIYTRVSTERQEENYSLGTQLEACRRYAEQQGIEVVAEFSDVASGASLDRPELTKLRTLVRERLIEAVIVYTPDRLSRSLAHTLVLRDEFRTIGCELHFVTTGKAKETPEGDLLGNIEAVIAEYERTRIAERMQRGKRGKVTSGQILGHGLMAPYGYGYTGKGRDKELVIVPEEAEVVRMIFTWYVQEGLSINAITTKLSEMAIQTPAATRPVNRRKRGSGQWGPTTINRMLKNSTYAGVMQHFRLKRDSKANTVTVRPREEWVAVEVPAIIDGALFEAAQARLGQGQAMSKRNSKTEYLLGRRIRCECDHALAGEWSKGTRVYRCVARGRLAPVRCTMRMVKADVVERIVWEWVEQQLNPDVLKEGIALQRAQAVDKRTEVARQIDTLTMQRADLDEQVRRLIDGFQVGVLKAEELAERRGALDVSMQSVDAEIALLQARLTDSGPTDAEIDNLLILAEELHQEFPHLTFERRRRLFDLIDLRVMVDRDTEGRRWANITARLALPPARLAIDGIVPTIYLYSKHNSTPQILLSTRIPIDQARHTGAA